MTTGRTASTRVAILAVEGVPLFHLSVPVAVFNEVGSAGAPAWTTAYFTEHPGSVTTADGHTIGGIGGVAAAADADLIVIPWWRDDGRPVPVWLRQVLLDARARGAKIAGLCLGALPVVDAGLLDGRTAVTHWMLAGRMAARYPAVTVHAEALYIDHGDIITAAGTASGLDACLHIVRERVGAEAASIVARSLVVAPHRGGGQAQYIARPLPEANERDPIGEIITWSIEHLDEPLTVGGLARRSLMSKRTFLRAFRATTGTSPAAWIRSRRLDEARRLLEQTDLPIELVSSTVGFGSSVALRQNFAATFATSPSEYRRRFRGR